MKTCFLHGVALALLLSFAGVASAKDKPAPEDAFKKMDTDGDGKLSLAEFKGKKDGEKATKAEAAFKAKDKDNDGYLTLEEFKAGGKKK